MENLMHEPYRKYQVTIFFEMDELFMQKVPPHRQYINSLIERGIVEYYAVSLDTQRCWMIVNAFTTAEVHLLLEQSPLHRYWKIDIAELYVYDAWSHRLPALQMN
jgi:hypothetical protein